jgi:hypothetical protein
MKKVRKNKMEKNKEPYYKKAIEILEAEAKKMLFESKDINNTFEDGYRLLEAAAILKEMKRPKGYLGLDNEDDYTFEVIEEKEEGK